MKEMKYVLNINNNTFLFIPDFMNHADIQGTWTNAGFVSFNTNERDDCGNVIVKARCYGKSVSLKLSCGEDDEAIINLGIKDRW